MLQIKIHQLCRIIEKYFTGEFVFAVICNILDPRNHSKKIFWIHSSFRVCFFSHFFKLLIFSERLIFHSFV